VDVEVGDDIRSEVRSEQEIIRSAPALKRVPRPAYENIYMSAADQEVVPSGSVKHCWTNTVAGQSCVSPTLIGHAWIEH